MNHRRLALVTFVGAVMSASGALAQAGSSDMSADQMAAGRQARRFDLMLTGKVDYDSNVGRAGPALAALQDLQPADTIYSPTLNVDLIFPIGRQALFLKGLVGYSGYENNTRLNHSRYDLTGGVGNSLGPCGSMLSGGYLVGRTTIDDPSTLGLVANVRTVERLAASVACHRAPSLGVFASVQRDWASNSITLGTNGDYQTSNVSAGFQYQRPAFGVASLFGAYSQTLYSQDHAFLGSATGYEARSVGLKFERKLGGRIEASVSVGYTNSDISIPTVPNVPSTMFATNFSGLTYEGDVSFRASSRLDAEAKFSRAIIPTQIAGGAYELLTSGDIRAGYKFGSRITLGASVRDGESRVFGNIPITNATVTNSRTLTEELSLRYRQSRRLTVAMTGTHEERTADARLFDYHDNRVGLALEVTY